MNLEVDSCFLIKVPRPSLLYLQHAKESALPGDLFPAPHSCGPHHENKCCSDIVWWCRRSGTKPFAFQHKLLSLRIVLLLRTGARPHVPSQFPGTYHLDSCGGMIYNHLAFSSRKLKKCHLPWNSNCRASHRKPLPVTFCRTACLHPQPWCTL